MLKPWMRRFLSERELQQREMEFSEDEAPPAALVSAVGRMVEESQEEPERVAAFRAALLPDLEEE